MKSIAIKMSNEEERRRMRKYQRNKYRTDKEYREQRLKNFKNWYLCRTEIQKEESKKYQAEYRKKNKDKFAAYYKTRKLKRSLERQSKKI